MPQEIVDVTLPQPQITRQQVKAARVLARIVVSPHTEAGEVVILWLDSRTVSNPDEVVYSVTRDEWRVEHHRKLMWRTRRADGHEVEHARAALRAMDPAPVNFMQSAARAGQ